MLRKLFARAWRLCVAMDRPGESICLFVRGGPPLGLPLLKPASVYISKLFLPVGASPRFGHILGSVPVFIDAASARGTVENKA